MKEDLDNQESEILEMMEQMRELEKKERAKSTRREWSVEVNKNGLNPLFQIGVSGFFNSKPAPPNTFLIFQYLSHTDKYLLPIVFTRSAVYLKTCVSNGP